MTVAFEPTLMAESLINILAAAGLALVARANQRIDPHGPVTGRIAFALSLVAALFLLRAAGWLAGSDALAWITTALAGATPLVALFVVEGLLRRHAPLTVKAALSGGCIAMALVAVLNARWTTINEVVLFVLVVGGYLLLTWLLVSRDKASLTSSENRTIRRLLTVMPFLLIMLATDFRELFPHVPIRLGALGVLVLMYSCFGADGLSAPGKTRILNLLGFLLIATALAVGFATTQSRVDNALDFEIATVVFAGLVLAALVSEEIGARSERARAPSPLLRAVDPAAFEAALKSDALLQDARILIGPELYDAEGPELTALLKERPILRRKDAPWGLSANNDGVERAMSLLQTYEATHLMRLGSAPLRIAAFAVPPIADDPRTEIEIVIAQRLGEAFYSARLTMS